ncbi:MAG: alkane 1-monooxygenase [Bacteroidota bacterium]
MLLSHRLKYLIAYAIPFVIFLSLYLQGVYSYLALATIFGLLPLSELFLTGTKGNLNKIERAIVKEDRLYDILLYGMVPVQYGLLFYYLYHIGDPTLLPYERVGMTIAMGISCGVLGINVAHELGHRSTKFEQNLSKALLLTSLYMHFFIEHNRGHHKHVSTDDDPASSRLGEWVYAFWVRSAIGGWLSAWKLEAERLEKKKQSVFSLRNEMLVFQLIQVAFVLLIFALFDSQTTLYFFYVAMIGFLLLETVNYIEHYGLRRKKDGEFYQRTLPAHSWNSNHPIGRLVLFELSRHSDHHYIANRKFQTLRHFEESPQMPTGYPGMMLLSLVPPLWFLVMHRKLDRLRATSLGSALA